MKPWRKPCLLRFSVSSCKFWAEVPGDKVGVPKRVGQYECDIASRINTPRNSTELPRLQVQIAKIRWCNSRNQALPVITAKPNFGAVIERKARHVQTQAPIQQGMVGHVEEFPQAAA